MILRGSFFSNTLEMETGISVLVPNKSLDKTSHKVVYLLHGMCGRNGDWLDYTMLPAYAEKFNAVFVMPDAARSFYTDMTFGQKYFSFVIDELPRICRSAFNISSSREDTAVIGASMGGYGALKCGFTKPDHYGFCGAFSSPCLYLKEGLENQRKYGKTPDFIRNIGEQLINDFESIFGPDLDWKPGYEILELAGKAAEAAGSGPSIYLACGTEDPFLSDNRRFRQDLEKLDFNLTCQEWQGAHDWTFFNAALERALEEFCL